MTFFAKNHEKSILYFLFLNHPRVSLDDLYAWKRSVSSMKMPKSITKVSPVTKFGTPKHICKRDPNSRRNPGHECFRLSPNFLTVAGIMISLISEKTADFTKNHVHEMKVAGLIALMVLVVPSKFTQKSIVSLSRLSRAGQTGCPALQARAKACPALPVPPEGRNF